MTKAIDITQAIRPKSDQLNADDLLTGPRTIRIRDVKNTGGEQPVSVYFYGDDGKPWKPAKSALRVLAAVWGPNAAKWIGLHCTIYNDETVTWAGVAVGGIRVSHMEGLSKSRTLMLTKTRGKKVGVTIEPLNLKTETRADKIRARLFEVAEGQEMSVADAWAKLSDDDKADLGDDLLTQLQQVEQAAQEHRENDPNAAADDLNEALGGDD
ncbi:hypothetical protein BXY70_1345 [Roseovarius halotolerans]|uniref:Uncharacterized protein n=1 Tax=Roseovarius halotolerans TaxID=505353 RepID=A0A1X6Y5N5_9RHOB|nr:hypothetical protein [Roseovarius halotolerans]RKT35312.1 hypothetical protein BXY70_1345 [Roseovarius halotolerans]SLN11026.1 hypothetical protein ROH8110_00051 [Roseovarius halotolerans]